MPYQAPQDYIERYKAIKDEKRRTYAAMITALDDQIGRIVAALDKKGMRDNTLIIFSSDNGGAISALFATGARSEEERKESGGVELGARPPASNGALRGGKGGLHEGGVRVPSFVNWPAKLQPRTVNEPLHMVDIMPTLLALAGGKGSPDHPMDGKDIWPTLTAGKPSRISSLTSKPSEGRSARATGSW
jgi:arylsulfatase A-like enzyme